MRTGTGQNKDRREYHIGKMSWERIRTGKHKGRRTGNWKRKWPRTKINRRSEEGEDQDRERTSARTEKGWGSLYVQPHLLVVVQLNLLTVSYYSILP
jgi:hypothetical protein